MMKMKKTVKMMPPESSPKGEKTKRVISLKKMMSWNDEENNGNDAAFVEPTIGRKRGKAEKTICNKKLGNNEENENDCQDYSTSK